MNTSTITLQWQNANFPVIEGRLALVSHADGAFSPKIDENAVSLYHGGGHELRRLREPTRVGFPVTVISEGWGMASSAIGVLLALVGFAQISEAQPQATVGEIANFCGASDDFSQDMCKYYVITMVGSIKVSQDFVHSKKVICIPDSVSEKEIISRFLDAVKSDLKSHPLDAAEPAAAMIFTMVEASFPCPLQ